MLARCGLERGRWGAGGITPLGASWHRLRDESGYRYGPPTLAEWPSALRPLAPLLLFLVSCSPSPEPASSTTDGSTTGGAAERVTAVDSPNLSRHEADVRRQIDNERARLERVLANPTSGPATRARAYGAMGMVYHAYEFFKAAADCYQRTARLEPREFRWVYLEGCVHERNAELVRAAECFAHAHDLEPRRWQTLVRLGEAEIQLGRFESAVEHLTTATRAAPDQPRAHYALGRALSARGRHAEAVPAFERALILAPQASRIHYPLALSHRAIGHRAEAARHSAQRGDVSPVLPDPWLAPVVELRRGERSARIRGLALLHRGRIFEGVRSLQRAVDYKPNSVMAHVNYAIGLTRTHRNDEAIEQYRAALRLVGTHATAHLNLGALLAARGEDSEARAHFWSALRAAPLSVKPYLNLAECQRRLGGFLDSAATYRSALELDPGNRHARRGEILALIGAEQWSPARAALEEALELYAVDAEFQGYLARILAACPETRLRDPARALTLARAAFRATPHAGTGETLAMALAATGRHHEALRLVERVLARGEPDRDPVRQAKLQHDRDLYRAGKPAVSPWAKQDPLLAPASVPKQLTLRQRTASG